MWTRPKNDITEEQYQEFYKHVAHDFEAPLAYTHNRVEGRKRIHTTAVYSQRTRRSTYGTVNNARGIKLYVRRVFIMDDAEQLLPEYLRFVRGVIDSANLPLNVSREILQASQGHRRYPRLATVKRVLS